MFVRIKENNPQEKAFIQYLKTLPFVEIIERKEKQITEGNRRRLAQCKRNAIRRKEEKIVKQFDKCQIER